MRYQDCSTQELKAFVADRKLVLPPDTDTKRRARARRAYIQVLEAADSDRKFRFMDLPPELRNRVYSCLTDTGDLATWNPQIIMTSTEVHNEAAGLAYKETWFDMTIGVQEVSVQGVSCGRHTHGAWNGVSLDLLRWPSFLLKVCRLKINVDIPESYRHLGRSRPAGFVFIAFNNILYSLCTYLAQANRLTSIHLEFPLRTEGWSIKADVRSLCYPLRLLSTLTTIEIPVVDETTLNTIKDDVIKAQPHTTALMGSEPTIEKAKRHSRLIIRAGKILRESRGALNRSRLGATDRIMDAQWEASLVDHVERMEKILSIFDDVDLDRLETVLKEEG